MRCLFISLAQPLAQHFITETIRDTGVKTERDTEERPSYVFTFANGKYTHIHLNPDLLCPQKYWTRSPVTLPLPVPIHVLLLAKEN